MNDQTQYEVLERMAILMDGNDGMTYEIALKQAVTEIKARDKKPDDDFSFLGG
jgi:hypothetical protein